jgi:DNA-binding response OmpR family regulator
MQTQFPIYVIDDEPGMQDLLAAILHDHYPVETFATAEQCLQRIAAARPQMLLVDVGLPGMDGYALCRQIKDDAATSHIPVLFVSGHDTIDARLQGYEAGGEDFIVKPFEPEELLSKVKVAQHIVEEQRQLRDRADFAERTALSAMTSLGDLGAILGFLRKSFSCGNGAELANAILDACDQYGLQGAVQIRMKTETRSLSRQGANLPLETAVLDYVSQHGRIYEFQKRSAHNFGGITLLVSNIPVEDIERCGRIRDNLAILAEGADARRQAIEIEEDNRRAKQTIANALENIQTSLDTLGKDHERDQFRNTGTMIEIQEAMVNTFLGLGLSEQQENGLIDLVRRHFAKLQDELGRNQEIVEKLENLAAPLRQLTR